ncbi:MAG: magnesium chelatase subunit D family protein [Clostridia bacterium]|nr:magnesium chelatase subunit D family protein [Clostridia bacterium]
MKRKNVFPFCAVIGQDNIKTALILNAVNPSIGGVLISGQKGTAKSTLVRGLAALLKDTEVIDLPLNVTEDRLIGTIDIEKAIKSGQRSFEPGILMRAHGNILYVDEVNLLSDYIVNCLLEVSASRVNHVEREGISCCHPSSFVLAGTMNPEEGELRPQFLDRFGLFVEAKGSEHPAERKEIIKRRLEYENKPLEYIRRWEEETEKLCDRISKARQLLASVKVSESILKLASEISTEGNCAGHRAELALIETAKAMAAFDNRKYITALDVKNAAELALPHRIRKFPPQCMHEKKTENDKLEDDIENSNKNTKGTDETEENESNKEELQKQAENPPHMNPWEGMESPACVENSKGDGNDESVEDKIEAPGELYQIKPLNISAYDKKMRKGSGKRSRTKTSSLQGSYIRYTFPKGKVKDIAFDATLRAAAPCQKSREAGGVAVSIKSSDFREKVRKKRTGNTILFIVDASGSMGTRKRMKAVKGAILSILNDAYQKRDRVGMVAFRKDRAELVLGITRSVELAEKSLRELPTGGKTPLASGLYTGYEVLKAAMVKDPDIIPLIVLVSDGRANVSLKNDNPVEEALSAAKTIRAEGIRSLVIDTENDFIKLGLASKIAKAMGAEYLKLDELEQKEIESAVRSVI